MVEIGADAARHLHDLRDHYEAKQRLEAALNLAAALAAAIERIRIEPDKGLTAPRPYPHLVADGLRWIKEGRYWFVYSVSTPPVIVAVFHDQADIPSRARLRG